MKNLLIFTILSVLVFTIISCAKKKTDDETMNPKLKTDPDKELPVISYLTNLNSLYSIGAKVKINFKVTDNVKLKNVLLKVTNTTIDSVYLNRSENTTLKEMTILDSVITNLTTNMADFEVFIQAEDSTGNITTSTKGFHVMN
ncbi:MAG: hypothetical protein HUU48_11995 [Flavobacteriales bacterium]|nr:hypothetical protein [Flavobacteriales bacterium]